VKPIGSNWCQGHGLNQPFSFVKGVRHNGLARGSITRFPRDKMVRVDQSGLMAVGKAKSDRCVPLLKALADEHRWAMVRTLLAESFSVSEIAERLNMPQPNVSKHLRMLRDAGIVVTERAGKEVRCAIAPTFRANLSRNKNRLDLGCCSFDFNAAQQQGS
jgi:DNA-binding transcriptional ArsR family regulator